MGATVKVITWLLCDVVGLHKFTPTRNLVVGGHTVASEEVCQRCGHKVVYGSPDQLREVDARDRRDQERMFRERCLCGHTRAEHGESNGAGRCGAPFIVKGDDVFKRCPCPSFRPVRSA